MQEKKNSKLNITNPSDQRAEIIMVNKDLISFFVIIYMSYKIPKNK